MTAAAALSLEDGDCSEAGGAEAIGAPAPPGERLESEGFEDLDE